MTGRRSAAGGDGMSLTVTIPGWVPDSRLSLNGRRRAGSWRETWRLQENAKAMMIPAIWASGVWHHLMTRAHVTVEFVYPVRRRRDADNLAGLAKPLLDALVGEGVLKDDSAEFVQLTVCAVVEPGVTETRVRIEPWEVES